MQLRHRALTGTTNRSNDIDLSREDRDYPSTPTPGSRQDCITTCDNEVISEGTFIFHRALNLHHMKMSWTTLKNIRVRKIQ